jgi:hypothetical protein
MMKELHKKGLVMLTYIFNDMLSISYWPKQLKTAEIILIPKSGEKPKGTNVVSSNKFTVHSQQNIWEAPTN